MVVPVNFSSAVPDKEAAGTMQISQRGCGRSYGIWPRRAPCTSQMIQLIGQLTTRKYIFSGAPAKLKLESKDALKKRGLTSLTALMR